MIGQRKVCQLTWCFGFFLVRVSYRFWIQYKRSSPTEVYEVVSDVCKSQLKEFYHLNKGISFELGSNKTKIKIDLKFTSENLIMKFFKVVESLKKYKVYKEDQYLEKYDLLFQ